MVSSVPSNSTKSPHQDHAQPATRNKVVPAIPLSYIQKRTQRQIERANARRKVEVAILASAKELRELRSELESDRSISSPSLPMNVSDSVPTCEENSEAFKPTLAIVRTESQKIESDVRHDISTNLDHRNPSTRPQKSEGYSAPKEENIHISHRPSKANENFTNQLELVQTSNGYCTSDFTHQTPSDSIPATLSHLDGINTESTSFPSCQTSGASHPFQNENFIISNNSQSNKSSPAVPQSTPYPLQSLGHVQPSYTCFATCPSSGHHSRTSPHTQSPVSRTPLPGHVIHMNGFTNIAAPHEFVGEHFTHFRSEEDPPTVTPIEEFLHYETNAPLSFRESISTANDRDILTPCETQNFLEIKSDNIDNREGNTQIPEEKSPAEKNRNHYSKLLPIHQSFSPQPDLFDGLIEYLSSQYADPTFSDTRLELRYSDDRETPVRIPGHGLIFARSTTLRDMISAMLNETERISSKTLLIVSNDRFLCNDGFHMAMHRLYGNPLLDLGPIYLNDLAMQYQRPSTSTVTERFNLALGYAAAGHLLKMHVVVSRGCEIASLLLSWATLEKALDFALDGGLEPHWMIQRLGPGNPRATYGPSVNIIIFKVIEFIRHNLPTNFELDVSVGIGRFALRLPGLQDERVPPVNPLLSHIRFGDYATEESDQIEADQSPTKILSRIFISLPWDLLRCIFESSRLAIHFGSVTRCHQILSSIIQERERRRITVFNSKVPNSERNKLYQEWLSVRWREEVEALCIDHRYPKLIRNWTDFNVPET